MMANKSRKRRSNRANTKQVNNARFSPRQTAYYNTGTYPAADRKRQVWDQAGYPEYVEPSMLFNESRRNGLVRGIINLKAGECWQNAPIVYDGDADPERREKNPTEFEQALDYWAGKWHLWDRLEGADRRQMVMRYSGLVMFAKEPNASSPDAPMQKLMGPGAIFKMMPVFETQIEVNEVVEDFNSQRYGEPKYFNFRSNVDGSRNQFLNDDFQLNPSRVITFAEGADDGSIYGVPEFESYFNALMDLEKIRMAGGEGFYKNASQKIGINLDPKLTQGLTAQQQEDFDDNIDDFNRDMNKALVLAGAEAKTLQSSLADPKEYAQMCYNEVAAGSGIPLTIIIGMQTGRLASDEDQTQKNVMLKSRQNKWCSQMVRKALDWLIKYGALPQPENDIVIEWPDISEPTLLDKVEVVEKMMLTNERAQKAQMDPVYSVEYMQQTAGVEVEVIEREEGDAGLEPDPMEL